SRYAFAYTIRGSIHREKRQFTEAIEDWHQAVRLDPNHSWTRRELAWILATCPEAAHRNGPEAVKHARRSCEITDWKDCDCLTGLATAHARSSQFRQAVRWQTEALRLAPESHKAFGTALLEMYRQETPYCTAGPNE